MAHKIIKGGGLSLLFIALLLGGPSTHAQAVPTQPSVVTVSGRQLLVQKRFSDGTLDIPRPYIMKGINWEPATIVPQYGPDPTNLSQTIAYGCFFNEPSVMKYWKQTEFTAHYQIDIPLMQQMGVNTVRIYQPLGDAATSKPILDAFYEAGIMVIMTVGTSSSDFTSGQYLTAVQQVMNHPAILMWSLGNEWNLNSYYSSYGTMAQATSATQSAAIAIKAVDPNHVVSSSLGDIFTIVNTACISTVPNSDIPTIVANAPGVDIWGLNIYRGSSFENLFQQWTATTTKPFFIGEFGIDSFSTAQFTLPLSTPNACGGNNNEAHVTAGTEDQATQSAWDLGLWKEIAGQLSAFNTQAPCVGGDVFAFNDELWLVGDYNVGLGGLTNICTNTTPNPDGFQQSGSYPDNVANEEYYGLVNASRTPKIAYATLENYYAGLAPVVQPTISSFNPPSAPIGGSSFTLSIFGSHFTNDSYVLWNGTQKPTTYINSSELQVSVQSSDLAQSQTINVYVVDPSTTGTRSPLSTFAIQQTSGLSAARVSPDPWRADRHSGFPITFDQLTPGSTVKIFTISARWVRTLAAPSGFVNWDLTNADGKMVASGIYLYLITDTQGNKTTGKLAIIR